MLIQGLFLQVPILEHIGAPFYPVGEDRKILRYYHRPIEGDLAITISNLLLNRFSFWKKSLLFLSSLWIISCERMNEVIQQIRIEVTIVLINRYVDQRHGTT